MKCQWTKRAEREYEKVVMYICNEFGKKAALDFIDLIEYWDERLAKYPETGSSESLLAGRSKFKYRSHIVSKHNKFIYTVDKQGGVTIVDIWDMRRNPDNLTKRIKSK